MKTSKTSKKASAKRTAKTAARTAKTATPARKATAKKAATKNAAPKKTTAKKVAAKSPARPMVARRADFGKPIDGFFAKQPPDLRKILEALRATIEEIAPDATASLKWGMPFYEIAGEPLCALAGFKSHVNLILPVKPQTLADPDGLLEGDGKTGRHLKVRSLDGLPHDAVRRWIAASAQIARSGGHPAS